MKKKKKIKQGRINGYRSRVRVGRVSDRECHQGIWAGAVSSKRPKRHVSKMGPDRPTNGRTKWGVESRSTRLKKEKEKEKKKKPERKKKGEQSECCKPGIENERGMTFFKPIEK